MSSKPTDELPGDDQDSQNLSDNLLEIDYVSVNFINKTGFTNTFTICDSNHGGAIVFQGSLDDQASTGFKNLVANGDYGEATYQYVGQAGPATGTGLLDNQQNFEMY